MYFELNIIPNFLLTFFTYLHRITIKSIMTFFHYFINLSFYNRFYFYNQELKINPKLKTNKENNSNIFFNENSAESNRNKGKYVFYLNTF